MKKSPLSTPSYNRGHIKTYKWKTPNNADRTDYQSASSDTYRADNRTPSYDNNFIPLNMSTPVIQHRKPIANWHTPTRDRNNAGTSSGGYNRNNYYNASRANSHNLYSPYNNSGKCFHRSKGSYRGTRKQVNISAYVDMYSFLEDPWEKLEKKLDTSNLSTKESNTPMDESTTIEESTEEVESKSCSNVQSNVQTNSL